MPPEAADPVAAAAESATPAVPQVTGETPAPEPEPAGQAYQFVGGPLGGESRRLAVDATGHVLPGGEGYELNAGRMVYVGVRMQPPPPPVVATTPMGDVTLNPDAALRVRADGSVGDALQSQAAQSEQRPPQRVAVGRVVHYVLPSGSMYVGQHRAAEIVQVWDGDQVHVNLLVKKGQPNDFRGVGVGRLATDEFQVGDVQIILPIILLGSVRHDEERKEPGTWHWPERV